MPKVENAPRCDNCGDFAIITIPMPGGITVHKCYDCYTIPQSQREEDDKILKKLGLIK